MFVCVCALLVLLFFFLMILRPSGSTRTDILLPYPTLFRSACRTRHATGGWSARFRTRPDTPWRTPHPRRGTARASGHRSEEHTSELQSLMRISYAVFCLKKKRKVSNRQDLLYITTH